MPFGGSTFTAHDLFRCPFPIRGVLSRVSSENKGSPLKLAKWPTETLMADNHRTLHWYRRSSRDGFKDLAEPVDSSPNRQTQPAIKSFPLCPRRQRRTGFCNSRKLITQWIRHQVPHQLS
jgi:hypothetical protein